MGAREAIVRALLKGAPGGPHPGGIHVYHSSPHDFDRFDWSKIGTGEGANVYGAGFYFAENPKVSGQGGQYWQQFAPRTRPDESGAVNYLKRNQFDRDAAVAEIQRDMPNYKDPKYLDYLQSQLELLKSGKPVGPRTYEVNINARPELMLDWDKPLAGQQAGSPMWDIAKRSLYGSPEKTTGEQAYRGITAITEDPRALSEQMREAGIPGIRYLDQGSRFSQALYNDNPIADEARKFIKQAGGDTEKAGKLFYESNPVSNWAAPERDEIRRLIQLGGNPPSYNYVVTDPSKLDILGKYGVVGTAGGGLGVLAAPDNYQGGT